MSVSMTSASVTVVLLLGAHLSTVLSPSPTKHSGGDALFDSGTQSSNIVSLTSIGYLLSYAMAYVKDGVCATLVFVTFWTRGDACS